MPSPRSVARPRLEPTGFSKGSGNGLASDTRGVSPPSLEAISGVERLNPVPGPSSY